jgi:hypothetical protein
MDIKMREGSDIARTERKILLQKGAEDLELAVRK